MFYKYKTFYLVNCFIVFTDTGNQEMTDDKTIWGAEVTGNILHVLTWTWTNKCFMIKQMISDFVDNIIVR